MRVIHQPTTRILPVLLFLLLLVIDQPVMAQRPPLRPTKTVVAWSKTIPYFSKDKNVNLFGTGSTYIQNIGQYGDTFPGYGHMGKILYAYEGLRQPVLFTNKGMIHIQRKLNKFDHEEMEAMERSGALNREIDNELMYTDRVITIEWINANPNPQIVAGEPTDNYYTYSKATGRAKGFQKITYKDLYPGIDLVYSFASNGRPGFEYSLVIHPGADASKARFRVGGQVSEMGIDTEGSFFIATDIDVIRQTMPVSFYQNGNGSVLATPGMEKIQSSFAMQDKEVGFALPGGYDKTKTVVIDPFVSATSSLVGVHAGIAKDIDFDYAGNVYVSGGGNSGATMLAKFDKDGNLLWTFNGSLTAPVWSFGIAYGGWVVEKTTGKSYLGQGGSSQSLVIRLDTDGQYDNFITTRDPNVEENWKMIWNCDGGTPKIFIAGGGSGHNINLGICSPPSTSVTALNITGQPTGHQDVADMVVDPKTNELYTIFAQGFVTPITENNKMYKHSPPYNSSTIRWQRMSGYILLSERSNRPYLGMGFNDNSINGLAVNSNYLFYYDGLNLKALNKSNGADVGSPITLPSTGLMQGGIIADECDNVYIGSINGTIKVYKFDGSTFNDGAATDITIAGHASAFVYDLAYDNGKNLLYACGSGFVAAINISANCSAAIYNVTVRTNCGNLSATATLSPSPPAGSTVTYVLYDGATELSSNTDGIFTRLSRSIRYTVQARIDEACGGTHAATDFDLFRCSGGPGVPGIYVPTAFTPNGDGLNDILKAVPFDMELKRFTLYNRWGEIIFTTTDADKGWDGTFKGKKQDTGVFVWQAEAVDFDNIPVQVKGTTTLIR